MICFVHKFRPALLAVTAMAAMFAISQRSVLADNDAHTSSSKPNIIILFADDMRASTIHAMGVDDIKTPNLDKLVEGGLAFPHAYIMGGNGGAVCVYSRAMLMTGKNLHHLQKNGKKIPEDWTMIGQTLGKAGYNTYGIGKWHNNIESYVRCFKDGDEIFFNGMTNSQWNIPLCHYHKDGKYEGNAAPDIATVNNFPVVSDHIYRDTHSSEIFTSAAVNFLNSDKSKNPFFMYVAYTAPHDPRQAPQKFKDMYDPKQIKLPPNFMPQHPFDNGHTGRDEQLLGFPRKPDEVKKEIADYFAIISHLDSQIGRIMETLEKTGKADNTIVIFAGDNGLAVGQHGLLGKQNLYEHSVNVPMIWSGPGIPKGKKSVAYAYLTEIYPTLCEMLNIDVPESVDEKSFLASIKDPEKPFHDYMYYSFRDIHRAVTDGRYKLIEYNVDGVRHTQLFDLKNDPWELKNLADDPAMKDKLDLLRKKIVEYKKKTGDKGAFWKGF